MFYSITQKNKNKQWVAFLLLGIVFVTYAVSATAFAQFNPTINYQGKLADELGVTVPNGGYDMVFRLYTTPTGGSAIWTESLVGGNEVTVTNGLFSVMLGEVESLTGVDFNQTLYLGVTIEADAEMSPRKVLGTVPAAFVAEQANNATTVGGVASTSLVRNDTAGTIDANTSGTLFSFIQNGAGAIARFFSGATEVFTILGNGNVGVGTSTPDSLLTVAGTIRATGTVRFDTLTTGLVQSSGNGTLSSIATSSLGLGNGTFLGLTDTPGTFTANRIPFTNAGATAITDDANFTFNGTNLVLGGTTGISLGGDVLLNRGAANRLDLASGDSLNLVSGNLQLFGTNYLTGNNTTKNVTLGELAGASFATSGTGRNVAIGFEAGRNASTTGATFNNYIGDQAGRNSTGTSNNIFGDNAGVNNTGSLNNLFGPVAGFNNTGSDNNLFGSDAGFNNTGDFNNLFGLFAGANNTGSGNNLFGASAGANNTGSYSEFFGIEAGARMSASNTIAIGRESLRGGGGLAFFGNAATTTNNTAIGAFAGFNVQTGGDNNLLLGYRTGYNLTTGANNIAIGYDIDLPSNTASNQLNIGNLIFGTGIDGTGTTLSSGNIGIGTSSPYAKLSVNGDIRATGAANVGSTTAMLQLNGNTFLQAGSGSNTLLGLSAGRNSTAVDSIIIGNQAGELSANQANIIIGQLAGRTTTGFSNIIMGYYAGFAVGGGQGNVLIGEYAGYSNRGSNAVGIGRDALFQAGGLNNIGIGRIAGFNATTSEDLIAIGDGALALSNASRTIAIGAEALRGGAGSEFGAFSTTQNNIALGYRAGYNVTTGANNLILGYQAADSLTTGANNIAIGYDIDLPSNTASNQLNIGNLIFGTGIDGTGTTLSSGNIGIGTTTPSSRLTVAGDAFITGALRDSSNNAGTAGMILQTTGTGTQWVATSSLGISGGGSATFLGLTDTQSSFTANRVIFTNAAGNAVTDSANFLFNASGLGLGGITPTAVLTLASSTTATGGIRFGTDVDLFRGAANRLDLASGDSLNLIDGGLMSNGSRVFYASTTLSNISIGQLAGQSFLGGIDDANDFNIAFGYAAGRFASSSVEFGNQYNAFIGYLAGYNNIGSSNVLLGKFAGNNNSGDNNNFIGEAAGSNNSGSFNNYIGFGTGQLSTGVSFVNAIGYGTALHNSGSFSDFIGNETAALMSASNTVAIGNSALRGGSGILGSGNAATTTNNTAIGAFAGFNVQTGGDNNLLLGYRTGYNLTTGANNIAIGYDIDLPSNTASNQLNIGNLIFGTGIDGTGTTLSTGNIGIGTTTPSSKLDVWGDFRVGTSSVPTLFVDTQRNGVAIGTSTLPLLSDLATLFTVNSSANVFGFQVFEDTTYTPGSSVVVVGDVTDFDPVFIPGGYNSSFFVKGYSKFEGPLSIGAFNDIEVLSFGGSSGASSTISALGSRMEFEAAEFTFGDRDEDVVTSFMTILNTGNVGIGTSTPSSRLTIAGDAFITGALRDSSNNAGTAGMILQTTGTGTQWVATSSLGIGGVASTFLGLTDTLGTFTANRIPFTNAGATAITDDANFTFNGTNLVLGGTTGVSLGGDVLLNRGAANRLDLASGDSLRIVSGSLQFGTDVSLSRGAPDRLDLDSGDSLNLVSGSLMLFGTNYLTGNNTTKNVTLGELAGASFATSGTGRNVAIGNEAGQNASSTGAIRNIYIGNGAGRNSTGSFNNFFGTSAGSENTGTANNALGFYAGSENTGSDNNFLGFYAGLLNRGSGNNMLGAFAGTNNTGSFSEFIGFEAAARMSASNTVAIGRESLRGGSGDAEFSGNAATTTNNTAIGAFAGFNVQTGGDNNLLLGYRTGYNLTTGANNIAIGYDIDLPSNTASNQLNIGNLIFGTGIDGTGTTLSTGNIGIGTSSPSSRLTIERTGVTGAATAGITQYYSYTNSTNNAVQFGNFMFNDFAPTATTTFVASLMRVADSTAFGNTVRGLEVQVERGTNTQGENTAISGLARTFGVRGVTLGDAGGLLEPAGGFFETRGTIQGNAIRGFSNSITSADMMQLLQASSTFTGNGLVMNFGTAGGSFSGRFVDFQEAGVSVFRVADNGNTFIDGSLGLGTTTPATKLQVIGDIRVGTTGTNGCIERFDGTALTGTCSSDERLKTNITALTATSGPTFISRFAAMDVVTYTWNQTAADLYRRSMDTTATGVLAQNVEVVFPELVAYDNRGFRTVDLSTLSFYVIEALKEMWQTILAMRERVDTKELCLEDVCITADELRDLLNQSESVVNPAPAILYGAPITLPLPTAADPAAVDIAATTTDTSTEVDPVALVEGEEDDDAVSGQANQSTESEQLVSPPTPPEVTEGVTEIEQDTPIVDSGSEG